MEISRAQVLPPYKIVIEDPKNIFLNMTACSDWPIVEWKISWAPFY